MKNMITFDLRYIVANISGTVNNHDILRDEGEECKARKDFTAGKESHEMTIKYFLADKILNPNPDPFPLYFLKLLKKIFLLGYVSLKYC